MKAAVIGKKNGKGLEKDFLIISKILEDAGIEVVFGDIERPAPLDGDTDVCIFTEVVAPRFMGKINVLIPNQEWFYLAWLPYLDGFDAIFCKSRLAEHLFAQHHTNVVFTGFTSIDHYSGAEKKLQCFHSQGGSRAKGTPFVVKAWEDSSLPPLHIVSQETEPSGAPNIILYNKKLEQDAYLQLMNESWIHVCPSIAEGFGHSINEAKSCGAVVITTDAPPMNELVKKPLIPVENLYRFEDRLAICATIDPLMLRRVVKRTLKRELAEIGRQNRISFLKNDEKFRQRLLYHLSKL